MQIQANLGEGHVNIINAFEAVLTETHLALVMEYAACGESHELRGQQMAGCTAYRLVSFRGRGPLFHEGKPHIASKSSTHTLCVVVEACCGRQGSFGLLSWSLFLMASCCSTPQIVSPLVGCVSIGIKCLMSILILLVVCAAIHTCCRLLPQAQCSAQVPPRFSRHHKF